VIIGMLRPYPFSLEILENWLSSLKLHDVELISLQDIIEIPLPKHSLEELQKIDESIEKLDDKENITNQEEDSAHTNEQLEHEAAQKAPLDNHSAGE
jgi:hypothetical protein